MMRIATDADAALIARLHATSWKSAYRTILDPDFLAGPLDQDRLDVWTSRLAQAHSHEITLIAEIAGAPVGFVCAVGADDERWGTLIDNLHVLPEVKGMNLGTALLGAAADWSLSRYPEAGIHLWCFEQNAPARRFYERRGGVAVEQCRHDVPGGGDRPVIRYHWSDPAVVGRFRPIARS